MNSHILLHDTGAFYFDLYLSSFIICRQDQTNLFLKILSTFRLILLSLLNCIHFIFQSNQILSIYCQSYQFLSSFINFIKFYSFIFSNPFRLRDKPDASFQWGIPLFPFRLRDKPEPRPARPFILFQDRDNPKIFYHQFPSNFCQFLLNLYCQYCINLSILSTFILYPFLPILFQILPNSLQDQG